MSPGMTELVSVDSIVKLVLDKLILVSSSTSIPRVVWSADVSLSAPARGEGWW